MKRVMDIDHSKLDEHVCRTVTETVLTHSLLVLAVWIWLVLLLPRFASQYSDLLWGAGFPPDNFQFILTLSYFTRDHSPLILSLAIGLLWIESKFIRHLYQNESFRRVFFFSGGISVLLISALLLLSYMSASPGLMIAQARSQLMEHRGGSQSGGIGVTQKAPIKIGTE